MSSPVLTWNAYSTYCLLPGAVPVAGSRDYRLFNTPKGRRGQGFNRTLTAEETNLGNDLACPYNFQPCIRSVRILRMEWDIYAPDERGSATMQVSTDASLETRPAGLLLYGSLRLELSGTDCSLHGPWPLTQGLPYGPLQDDLFLRGGVGLNPSDYRLTPNTLFAVELHIKPGYRPAREVHIRVHLHMEGY